MSTEKNAAQKEAHKTGLFLAEITREISLRNKKGMKQLHLKKKKKADNCDNCFLFTTDTEYLNFIKKELMRKLINFQIFFPHTKARLAKAICM